MHLQADFELIDESAARWTARNASPGLSLAITDREKLLHCSAHGYADLAARTPLTVEHMSEFGSIGKSFTAILCLQLQEEGRLDLLAPVAEYLPWFEVRSKHRPITPHDLLTHTSGLIGGTDFSPDPRFEVWALRETEAVAAPGERFRYSNVGYKALGLMLERMTGQNYAALVRERILGPLDMHDTSPVIDHALRERLMVGYGWRFDDRPNRPGDPVVPATWLETNTADGCIAATPADLATYLRMLMNDGRGPSGRVLSEAAFARMARSYTQRNHGRPSLPGRESDEEAYGYGLYLTNDRPRLLGHGGGMVGYHSAMLADLDSGFGVTVFINGPGEPHGFAMYALDVLREAGRGGQLPLLPEPPDPRRIDNADDYAGGYGSPEGPLDVRATGDGLSIQTDHGPAPLVRLGADAFLVEHADFALFPLRFGRDDAGSVIEAWHGSRWWQGERYQGPTTFEAPASWSAFVGHYRSHNPWGGNLRVVLRKGALRLVHPSGGEEPLTPREDGSFRVGADLLASDFIRFDTVVEGEALRADYCCCGYYRFFTP